MQVMLAFSREEIVEAMTPFIAKKMNGIGRVSEIICSQSAPQMLNQFLEFSITFGEKFDNGDCPACGSKNIIKKGVSKGGKPNFQCKNCQRRFSKSEEVASPSSEAKEVLKEAIAMAKCAPKINEDYLVDTIKKMELDQTLGDVNRTRVMCGLPANTGTSKESTTNTAILNPKTLSTPTSTSPAIPDLDFLSLTAENMNNFIWSHHEQKKSPLEISEILRSKGLEWTEHMVENRLNKIRAAAYLKAKGKK